MGWNKNGIFKDSHKSWIDFFSNLLQNFSTHTQVNKDFTLKLQCYNPLHLSSSPGNEELRKLLYKLPLLIVLLWIIIISSSSLLHSFWPCNWNPSINFSANKTLSAAKFDLSPCEESRWAKWTCVTGREV